MEKLDVLVTGGEGFIAKGIVPHLGKRSVFCYSYDLITGADIFDKEKLAEALEGKDAVIHLAGLHGPSCDMFGHVDKDYKRINLGGSKAVFRAAKKAKVKRLVFASSIEVYGFKSVWADWYNDTPELPITEDTELPKKQHPYAKYKLETEKFFKENTKDGEITVVAIRFGGINGESPWSIKWENLAEAFNLALRTDKVKGFEHVTICDLDRNGVDLDKARRVLGYVKN